MRLPANRLITLQGARECQLPALCRPRSGAGRRHGARVVADCSPGPQCSARRAPAPASRDLIALHLIAFAREAAEAGEGSGRSPARSVRGAAAETGRGLGVRFCVRARAPRSACACKIVPPNPTGVSAKPCLSPVELSHRIDDVGVLAPPSLGRGMDSNPARRHGQTLSNSDKIRFMLEFASSLPTTRRGPMLRPRTRPTAPPSAPRHGASGHVVGRARR
jgi:hypothetical protein